MTLETALHNLKSEIDTYLEAIRAKKPDDILIAAERFIDAVVLVYEAHPE